MRRTCCAAGWTAWGKNVLLWFAVLACSAAAPAAATQPAALAFRPAEQKGFFQFDTGVVRGVLRLDGRQQGVAQLIHTATGVEVTWGAGHVGLLSPYRVFSTAERYGHAARDWPSRPRVLPDGAVEAFFPPGEDHPLELTLTYRWTAPDTLDMEMRVKPEQRMPHFELFLSSYFAEGFRVSVYLRPNRRLRGAAPQFVAITHHPLLDGNYMIFPRDRQAVLTIFDGRWDIPPNPVQWCITRPMAAPLALRRHATSGVTAVLMAPPDDCFALATPYDKTPPDGVASHRSLYLSLFGQDIAAGQTARARTRLVVNQGITNEAAVKRYHGFLTAVADRVAPSQ